MKYGKVLLTGGSGTLGKHVVSSGYFKGLLAPTHREMDITDAGSVERFFSKNKFDAVIHCAAMARVSQCEQDPQGAIKANSMGTANLVAAAMKKEARTGKKIRFVHISTDGVYQSTKGNYSEHDEAVPYNTYGWTKLAGESAASTMVNFCIIRTRFFDPSAIKYDTYATDSHSSMITVNELARAIAIMLGSSFVGTINIGGERKSDYDALKKHKPSIKPCRFRDIQGKVQFRLSKDASMNTSLWNRIEKEAVQARQK